MVEKKFLLEACDNFANKLFGNALEEFYSFDKKFVGIDEDFTPKGFWEDFKSKTLIGELFSIQFEIVSSWTTSQNVFYIHRVNLKTQKMQNPRESCELIPLQYKTKHHLTRQHFLDYVFLVIKPSKLLLEEKLETVLKLDRKLSFSHVRVELIEYL